MVSDKRRQYLADYVEKRKRINISVSESDFDKITYLAQFEGCKPTSYITQIIKAHLDKSPYVPQALAEEIQQIKFLLRNVANNVNQIAHRSNTLKVLVDERGLLTELQKLEQGLVKYIEGSADQ